MRQIIIARKDLNMSPGKLAAQVSHASMAFISRAIRGRGERLLFTGNYVVGLEIPKEVYEQWFMGVFTKTVCEAKNYNQLMRAVKIAQELGLEENKDYFLIWDACLTELTPEIIDEEGVGRTLTCIGFRPLADDVAWKISKKFQLYK